MSAMRTGWVRARSVRESVSLRTSSRGSVPEAGRLIVNRHVSILVFREKSVKSFLSKSGGGSGSCGAGVPARLG